ncbi:MAG: LuxR C-terminal-related transcriptional regulator, partial [Cyclobacteriaceae bacterium]
FEVKSRDIFLSESDAVAFKFRIYPPWYRSTLAYIGYIFLFISTFFISFYAYRRRYKKEKIKLIADQKKEIEIKETELTQLKNEKLESEISHKKRQLASSTMHLLDKNDLLSRLKTQINSLTDNEQLDQQSVKDLRRMVKEIDRNIDKDKSWEQFELHFDEVHGDFLKRISHEYDSMTPQEIKLAAYLRMNMTTKEIANLLKISVRGVEIARYRLRKKLDLNQGQNLVDFMLKY